MRISLARLLVATLLVFTLVPAAIVAVVMARGSSAAVEQMAGSILSGVADRIQAQTEGHLAAAHAALDGLVPAQPSTEEVRQVRAWLRQLDRFEPMAFAPARQGGGEWMTSYQASHAMAFMMAGTLRASSISLVEAPSMVIKARSVRSSRGSSSASACHSPFSSGALRGRS